MLPALNQGLSMIAGPEGHPPPDPASIASVLRLLAEAPDSRAFFATLRSALPRLLPATRIDLLASEREDGDQVLFSSGGESDAPPSHRRFTAAAFADWLRGQGYCSVSTLPVTGAGQHRGWLLLARRREPFDPDALALAGQLAALIALRLLYDQCRTDLAARDEYAALLEQRLHEVEEVRLRAMLAAGAAHDIGNLFAAVLGHAQLMQQNAPSLLQPDLRTIERAARDGHYLLRRVLALRAPMPAAPATPIALLPTIIHDAINLTRPFWERRPEIVIQTALAPVPAVRGHATELREVLINLIMNALAAMPDGGTLALRSHAIGDRVLVEVADTGSGIAQEHRGAIFQPLMTTRESGSGLGLSVSRTIVEGYGGTLTVDSAPGQGTTFTLSLPALRSHNVLHEAQHPSSQRRAC